MATRERGTWITAAEVIGLGLVLFTAPGPVIRLLFGLPLLVRLGYKALTSLPMGSIPGRPEGAKQERRRYDLRARVVVFLDEVRRAEDFAQQARVAGWPKGEVEDYLRSAQRRVVNAAAQVVKVTGRPA